MGPVNFSPPDPGSSGPVPIRGPNFSYLLPSGWRLTEEGPYSLVLHAPDYRAGIIIFGQSGLLQPLNPPQYAYHAMAEVMRLAPDVRLANFQPRTPRPGFTQAAAMDCAYTVSSPTGMFPIRGVAVADIAHGYGTCSGILTLATAVEQQWPHYQGWLPQVALAAVNTGPNAYGSSSMAEVMADIGRREHAAITAYRHESARLWERVTDERNASVDRQQGAMGPLLTGQEWLDDGYGGPQIRRSTAPAVLWRSRDGRELSSDDPSFDPRTPSDIDWRRIR